MNDFLVRGGGKSVSALVLHGSTWLLAGRLGRVFISLGSLAVLARLLDPADFGILAFAMIFFVLARTIIEPIVDIPAIRDDALSSDAYRAHVWCALAVGMVLAVGLFLAAPTIAGLIGVANLGPAMRLLAPALFVQAIYLAGNSLLRRRHQFRSIARISIINLIAAQACAIGLALAGWEWRALVVAQLVMVFLSALQCTIAARLDLRPPSRGWRTMRVGGFSASGLGALNWAATNLDTLFATAFLGAAATGLYSRAYNLITQLKEPFAEVDVTIRQAFGLSAAREGADAEALRAKVRAGLRLLALIAAFAAGGLVAVRAEFVLFLLGEKWLGAVPVLAALAIGFPLRIARIYIDSITIAWGSMRSLLGQRIMVALFLLAALFAVSNLGIVHIAAAISALQLFSFFLPGSEAERRVLPSFLSRLFALLPAYALFAAMVGAAELAALVLASDSPLLTMLARGAAAGLVAIIAFVLIPRGWLIGPLHRMRNRLLLRKG